MMSLWIMCTLMNRKIENLDVSNSKLLNNAWILFCSMKLEVAQFAMFIVYLNEWEINWCMLLAPISLSLIIKGV